MSGTEDCVGLLDLFLSRRSCRGGRNRLTICFG